MLSCVKTNLNTIIFDGAFIFCVFNYIFMIYFTGAGALKAPLCKGSCHANSVTEGLTTPPSKIEDFAHLPLHRGGFGAVHQLDKFKFIEVIIA